VASGPGTAYYGPSGQTRILDGQLQNFTIFHDALGNITSWGWVAAQQTVTQAPTAAAVATVTGVNPVETSYSLYGHTIPLSVFGRGRIGCEIIAGPWFNNGTASFIVSAGVPADPGGTRILEEIALDSEVVWTGSLTGAGTPSSAGFTTEPFTCRFYDGKLTQAADALETSHFGAQANAYRPQILLAVENLPIANTKFGKIPYIALLLSDTSGEDANYGEAFERLAASPWVNLAAFETLGITDGLPNGGLIFAQDSQFLQTIQQFGRFYPNWDILQTDKLRVVDRGAVVAADIVLDTTRLMGQVVVTRAGPDTIAKDLELSTIDNGADYTIVPSVAQRPRDPVAVTTSVGKDTAYLPAIMDAFTRTAVVTFTKYHEENARKTITGTAMAYGLEIEPGALASIHPGGDFGSEIFKIVETTRGVNNVVEFVGRAILRCSLGTALVGCSEATSFLARAPGLDATHTNAYIELICGLVSDGIFSKFDFLYVFATQNSTAAVLNLVSASSYNGTSVGAHFVTDRGMTGGPGGYIDSGFNPFTASSPKYVQDSAHIALWGVTNVGGTADGPMGVDSFAGETEIHPLYGDGNTYYRINGSAISGVANTTTAGFYLANRSSSSRVDGYKNGSNVLTNTSATSSPVQNYSFPICAMRHLFAGTTTPSAHQIAAASMGASLSATDVSNFYNRLRAYMTAVGVP
jgi:hypothetical protein